MHLLATRRAGRTQCPLWYLLWAEKPQALVPKDWDSGAQAAAGRVREAFSEVFGGGGVPGKEVFSFFFF